MTRDYKGSPIDPIDQEEDGNENKNKSNRRWIDWNTRGLPVRIVAVGGSARIVHMDTFSPRDKVNPLELFGSDMCGDPGLSLLLDWRPS